jgi:hypothetical protein
MESHCCDKSLMKTDASKRSHTSCHTSQGNNTSIHTHVFVECSRSLQNHHSIFSLKEVQSSVSEKNLCTFWVITQLPILIRLN